MIARNTVSTENDDSAGGARIIELLFFVYFFFSINEKFFTDDPSRPFPRIAECTNLLLLQFNRNLFDEIVASFDREIERQLDHRLARSVSGAAVFDGEFCRFLDVRLGFWGS